MKPILRRVLRIDDVIAASGYSKNQLEELISEGRFPAPFKLSPGGRARGWYEDEIITYQTARTAERDAALAATKPEREAKKAEREAAGVAGASKHVANRHRAKA
jgi:prophage regulatory protein